LYPDPFRHGFGGAEPVSYQFFTDDCPAVPVGQLIGLEQKSFEWVDANLQQLNGIANEAVAKGQYEFLLQADELFLLRVPLKGAGSGREKAKSLEAIINHAPSIKI